MILKPYYRIYRPNLTGNSDYITDNEYCPERADLIKYYNFLQRQVIDVFDYIEPCKENLKTFSAKNYQLLGNICMEVENNFKGIICANSYSEKEWNLNMKDYRNLNRYLKLSDYEIKLRFSRSCLKFKPFVNFNYKNKGIEWYQSYNSIKHNRTKEINQATLENVLKALGGLNILLRAQFYYYYDIINNENTSLINIQVKNGVFNSENALPIFKIINEPEWIQDEQYNFNWAELTETNNRFCKLEIEDN